MFRDFDYVVVFAINGGILFFAFIFLLFFVQNLGYATAENINQFYADHMTGIVVTFSSITVISTAVATAICNSVRKEDEECTYSIGTVIAYALGALLVIAQASFAVVSGVHDPFTHHYGGFLVIFSFIIAIILIIIDLFITFAVLLFGIMKNVGIVLMYVWAIAGTLLFGI